MNPTPNPEPSDQPLTKQQRRLLRRQLEARDRARGTKLRSLRRVVMWGGIIVVAVGAIGFGVWDLASRPTVPESAVVSRNGLHWHPQLSIVVKGEPKALSTNLGIGAIHNPIHTHEDLPILHLEFTGKVTQDQLQVGQFFRVWGKQFSSTCILDWCNGVDGTVRMTVNGQENMDFDRYVMQDKDQIEIRFD